MKSTRLLNALDSFQVYQGLKKDMESIFTDVPLDPVKDKVDIDKINKEISCFASSMEIEQEDFNKVCGFDVDLSVIDQRELYDLLKEIQDEENEMTAMSKAWDSGDACEMACNDPGLQYEQGEKVEQLWADFENTYNKTN
jgi:hypothetical protein